MALDLKQSEPRAHTHLTADPVAAALPVPQPECDDQPRLGGPHVRAAPLVAADRPQPVTANAAADVYFAHG